jgi:putative hemolysin
LFDSLSEEGFMFEILLIIFCIAMNAFLAGFEIAFVAVSRPLLRKMAETQETGGIHSLLLLKENPERTLSVIQVGITFVGVFAAAVGGIGAEKVLSPWIKSLFSVSERLSELFSLLVVTALLTYFMVVFGELIPKSFSLRRPFFVASRSAGFITGMTRVFWPVVLILEKSTKGLLNFFPHFRRGEEPVSPDYVSEEFSGLSTSSKTYVLNLLRLEKAMVEDVMIQWDEVDSLDASWDIKKVEDVIIRSGHTRLPVFKNDEVAGVLNAKEFLALLKTYETDWIKIIHPPLAINLDAPLLKAFRYMQKNRAHMAVVRNLHGTLMGIVTMEDIFEEVVGDIYDEDDEGSILKILSAIKPLIVSKSEIE